MALLLAGLAGVLIALQTQLLGRLTVTSGPFTTALVVQGAGFALAAVWATVTSGWRPVVDELHDVGWLVAGLVGWLLLTLLGQASARLGPGVTLAVVVSVQLVAAFAIDVATGEVAVGVRTLGSLALLITGVLGLVRA